MKTANQFKTVWFSAALACALSLPAQADLIVNGGFESDLAGWTKVDQLGSDGTFWPQTGPSNPVNGFPAPAPPGGAEAAMTDSGAGGSHLLYQDFTVPYGVESATVGFSLFLSNQAAFFNAKTLDWAAANNIGASNLNQQARVDIISTSADVFSVAGGSVLQNLFQTHPGDQSTSAYTSFLIDISALLQAHPGERLRLRFAEVDNVAPFNLGVDNVEMTATIVPSLTYVERKLVSDIPGQAEQTDPNLVNPWGIAFSPTSPFWIADNHAGVSTLYNSNAQPLSLVVTIPPSAGGPPPAAPTGVVYNNTPDFLVGPGLPARFIFATENGTIVGWNSGTTALLKADNSASGAIYKGLALGSNGGNNYLYAANFNAGRVDVLDANYNPITLTGSFSDPTLPAGFAPFNIQNVGGQLFVTYALQDAEKHDDVPGPGNGFVDVFDTSGQLIKRFISNGPLNSPWGVALAPAGFGGFSQALLIGNFGDGRFNAFDPATGQFLGMLLDASGLPIAIRGLWDLKFGNGGQAGDSQTLYFTAGIAGGGTIEDHGLFGSIASILPIITSIADKGTAATINWAGGVGPFLLQKKLSLSDAIWWNVLTTSNRSVTVAKEGASGFFRVVNQAQTTVLPFTVLLNGASEIPLVTTPATGLGTISIESNVLTYHISFSGLSSPAFAAHVHGAADATTSAGVLFPLNGASGTEGTLFGTHTLTPAELQAITNGLAYVNIHSTAHTGGEIRGQIMR